MSFLPIVGLVIVIGALVYYLKRRSPGTHHPDGPACGIRFDIFDAEFDHLFRRYGERFAFDWRSLKAISWCESSYDPCAIGRVGEVGLCQVSRFWEDQISIDIDAIEGNVHAAAWIFDYELRTWGMELLAVAAYNGGDAAVREAGAPDDPEWRSKLYPSIQKYLDNYEEAIRRIRARIER